MMKREDILNMIGRDARYKGYCYRYSQGKDPKLIYSEFLLIMCEKPADKIIELYRTQNLNKYCRNVIYTLINSKGSSLNYNPIKEIKTTPITYEMSIVEDSKSLKQLAIDKTLKEEGYWYNVKMYDVYIESGCNLAEVSRNTGIPVYTIRRTINYLKDKIKENYKLLCNTQ